MQRPLPKLCAGPFCKPGSCGEEEVVCRVAEDVHRAGSDTFHLLFLIQGFGFLLWLSEVQDLFIDSIM